MRSGCPEQLPKTDNLALVSESRECLKEKGQSKGLRFNVKKSKMIASSDKARKINKEGKFLCAVYRKGVDKYFKL